MTTGIYKIENLTNGKVYIGQSIHIERRWQEHCRESSHSLISKAIRKYGKESFSFQILEECEVKDLNDLESYYINFFNSTIPNGYNIEEKTETNSNYYSFLTKDIVLQIIADIKENKLFLQNIAEKYSISIRAIYYINSGYSHRFENENYPLREVLDFSKKTHFCQICGIEVSKGSKRCRKCSDINQRRVDRPNREELKKLIRKTSFVDIGRQYGVSDNSVRKWCTAEGLPSRKSDIKKYSDEEWNSL